MNSQIKVLSKNTQHERENQDTGQHQKLDDNLNDSSSSLNIDPSLSSKNVKRNDPEEVFGIKLGRDAKTFKLIDARDWIIASSEPSSEATFFQDGHSAMSIVSVIGPKGVGKSSLLNKLARKDAFRTYQSISPSSPQACNSKSVATSRAKICLQHVTRGIDIHSTYNRILLDCQPLLASSVLTDFLTSRSNSQFIKGSQITDPLVSCHMISLQLLVFLIATCDYVIIMVDWLIDIHLIKLLSSAIMLIGENNIRTEFVMFSRDQRIHSDKFKNLIDKLLGKGRIVKFSSDEKELYSHIAPYSNRKCDIYHKEPSTFTGKNWLKSCQRIWNSTIKNSTMFVDYANQLYDSKFST